MDVSARSRSSPTYLPHRRARQPAYTRYVFMKLYDGELRRDNCPKGDDQVIPFFRTLLRTVQALHRLGVTHEDIKRANVLLLNTPDRVLPVLADFGFAHFVPDGGQVLSLGGTVDYSSPEKVKVGIPTAFRPDLRTIDTTPSLARCGPSASSSASSFTSLTPTSTTTGGIQSGLRRTSSEASPSGGSVASKTRVTGE